jgi:hypothetical protein
MKDQCDPSRICKSAAQSRASSHHATFHVSRDEDLAVAWSIDAIWGTILCDLNGVIVQGITDLIASPYLKYPLGERWCFYSKIGHTVL